MPHKSHLLEILIKYTKKILQTISVKLLRKIYFEYLFLFFYIQVVHFFFFWRRFYLFILQLPPFLTPNIKNGKQIYVNAFSPFEIYSFSRSLTQPKLSSWCFLFVVKSQISQSILH